MVLGFCGFQRFFGCGLLRAQELGSRAWVWDLEYRGFSGSWVIGGLGGLSILWGAGLLFLGIGGLGFRAFGGLGFVLVVFF